MEGASFIRGPGGLSETGACRYCLAGITSKLQRAEVIAAIICMTLNCFFYDFIEFDLDYYKDVAYDMYMNIMRACKLPPPAGKR